MVHTLDVDIHGRANVIASAAITGPGGLAIVDPGPASSLDGLRSRLAALGHLLDDVAALLLTHIHLDHAGAAGTIVKANPRVKVFVHERGAPHIVDPARLIESARRLYGDRMDRLWGEMLPVPADRVTALKGGERLAVGSGDVRVAYTPGHAWHHVSYFDSDSGTAFIGDTGGVRVGAPLFVAPPTPPPDVDLERWDDSLRQIREWQPAEVFITHFGGFRDAAAHLDDLQARLHRAAALARSLVEDAKLDEPARVSRFVEAMKQSLLEQVPDPSVLAKYELAIPFGDCWQGLARYWRKKNAGT